MYKRLETRRHGEGGLFKKLGTRGVGKVGNRGWKQGEQEGGDGLFTRLETRGVKFC